MEDLDLVDIFNVFQAFEVNHRDLVNHNFPEETIKSYDLTKDKLYKLFIKLRNERK